MKKDNKTAYTILYTAKKGFSGCMKIGLAFAGVAIAAAGYIDYKQRKQQFKNNNNGR